MSVGDHRVANDERGSWVNKKVTSVSYGIMIFGMARYIGDMTLLGWESIILLLWQKSAKPEGEELELRDGKSQVHHPLHWLHDFNTYRTIMLSQICDGTSQSLFKVTTLY